MAKNWMVAEAAETLKKGEVTSTDTRDLMKRFPSFSATLLLDPIKILEVMDKTSVRKIEKLLVEIISDENEEEEVAKPAPKKTRKKKVEEEDDDDIEDLFDDDEE